MRSDIKEAMHRVSSRGAMRGDVRHLEEHLHEGEEVRELAGATIGGDTGALAVTDERVLWVFHGLLHKREEGRSLGEIRTVDVDHGVLGTKLTVWGAASRGPLKLGSMRKEDAEGIAAAIESAAAARARRERERREEQRRSAEATARPRALTETREALERMAVATPERAQEFGGLVTDLDEVLAMAWPEEVPGGADLVAVTKGDLLQLILDRSDTATTQEVLRVGEDRWAVVPRGMEFTDW